MGYKIRIKQNEKRKFQRLHIPLKIKCKWLTERGIIEEIAAQDISGGGLKIRVEKPFKEGERLKGLLYFPCEPRPVEVLSSVVWCKKKIVNRKECFDVGIKHIKIHPRHKERFVFLFCEMMINYFLISKKSSDGKNRR